MNDIEKLINELFEKQEKKQELAATISMFSFDKLYDLLECLRNVPEQEQEAIQKFKNAYAELYSLKQPVIKFIFHTISEMNNEELENLKRFIQEGF